MEVIINNSIVQAIRILDRVDSTNANRPTERELIRKLTRKPTFSKPNSNSVPIHRKEDDLSKIVNLLSPDGSYNVHTRRKGWFFTIDTKLIERQLLRDFPHFYFVNEFLVREAQREKQNKWHG